MKRVGQTALLNFSHGNSSYPGQGTKPGLTKTLSAVCKKPGKHSMCYKLNCPCPCHGEQANEN